MDKDSERWKQFVMPQASCGRTIHNEQYTMYNGE